MNHLTKVKHIQKLNEEELKRGIGISSSWHTKYKDSAYIYAGGFPFELTEGDLVIVFSQYGEIVDCRMARDKISGKSRGFAFLCYEDQRSTILAVDNLNGANLCGRVIRVDHVQQYKIPKEFFEADNKTENIENALYKPTGPDGRGWGSYRILSEEDEKLFDDFKQEEERVITNANNVANAGMLLDNEEIWEKEFQNLIHSENQITKETKDKKEKKKTKKKEKKEKKEKRRKEKETERQKRKEEALREQYKSYGVTNIVESKPNIQYIPEFAPKPKLKEEQI